MTARYTQEEATMHLRYLHKDGKRILQQYWNVTLYEGAKPLSGDGEWRDVPEVIYKVSGQPGKPATGSVASK